MRNRQHHKSNFPFPFFKYNISCVLLYIFLLMGSLQSLLANDHLRYNLSISPTKSSFRVTLTIPPSLLQHDSVYHFPAYVPGMHQKLDFGRLVSSFKAFDTKGNELSVQRTGINDWYITSYNHLAKIIYDIEGTFDLPDTTVLVHPQGGTVIRPEYAVINPHAVFGYFSSLLDFPILIEIDYPTQWQLGTTLSSNDNRNFWATSYKELLDSPILMGELTTSKTTIRDMEVEVFVYSPSDSINADTVLALSHPIINCAIQFIGYTPVSRYVLLVYFHDKEDHSKIPCLNFWGALEHGNSSTYALPAQKELFPYLQKMIAHEFMHILAPLNLHSNKLVSTDYSIPVNQDNHLWLYEGITEWASHIMLLRNAFISLDDYLLELSAMIRRSRTFTPPYSLLKLSNSWHTAEGKKQYGNIYQLGALTATILDLRLLRLSEGTRGLREVYLDLVKKYGSKQPFDNDSFFEEFITLTYPEIQSFIHKHIMSYTPFDFVEEFKAVGIQYLPVQLEDQNTPSLGFTVEHHPQGFVVSKILSPDTSAVKVKVGDIIVQVEVDDSPLDENTFLFKLMQAKIHSPYSLRVLREGKSLVLKGRILQNARYDVFRQEENATAEQRYLRLKWMTLSP